MSALKVSSPVSGSVASISGATQALKAMRVSAPVARPAVLSVQNKKSCQLTGKTRNKACNVSFSMKHSRKWQEVNLQTKKIFWPEANRLVTLQVSTKALRTIEKVGLAAMARKQGLDLASLPYTDVSPARLEYLEANKGAVPTAKNARAMKNTEKLASSKKTPMVASYDGGRIMYARGE